MRDSSTRTKDRKLSTESPTWTVQGYANSKFLHFVYQLLSINKLFLKKFKDISSFCKATEYPAMDSSETPLSATSSTLFW